MNCRDILLATSLVLIPALHARAADLDAGLTARGSFTTAGARAGDTVEYRLRVEWRDVPAAVIVLPPGDELKTPGLTLIGQSALHRKIASAGSVRNVSEFSYLLVAREAGPGRVAPFALRYRSGLSDRTDDRVESVPVEGSTIEIGPARSAWKNRGITWVILGGAGLLALGLLFARTRRAHARAAAQGGSRPAPAESGDAFTRGVDALRQRCDSADSRLWLRDAEKLCVAYLCRSLGVSKMREVRFEAALDQYQARPHAPEEDDSWTRLRDLFHEARYSGGRKAPHELRDACRHLRICLGPHAGSHAGPNDPTSVQLEKR